MINTHCQPFTIALPADCHTKGINPLLLLTFFFLTTKAMDKYKKKYIEQKEASIIPEQVYLVSVAGFSCQENIYEDVKDFIASDLDSRIVKITIQDSSKSRFWKRENNDSRIVKITM